jgi:hypothetical protein
MGTKADLCLGKADTEIAPAIAKPPNEHVTPSEQRHRKKNDDRETLILLGLTTSSYKIKINLSSAENGLRKSESALDRYYYMTKVIF